MESFRPSPLLKTLQKIVEEVGAADSIADALQILVKRVQVALAVNVCSVYLGMTDSDRLLLMATEGLRRDAVGRIRLSFEEGLVGLVAQRAEIVHLDDAPSHPRYKFFSETGEQPYHAFLGVPIIHRRRVLGVLVVQQRERVCFDDSVVAMLSTLAVQLATSLRQAEISGEMRRLLRGERLSDLIIHGLPGSPGVAIGVARVAYGQADLASIPDREVTDVDREIAAFERAIAQVKDDLESIKARMAGVLPDEERMLFDAYIMLLDSQTLLKGVCNLIHQGQWAPAALRDTVLQYARTFEEMDDSYLGDRAADIRDLGRRLLARILSTEDERREYPENTILLGDDVSAAELGEVPIEKLIGVVSARGSSSSHVAIMARALGIPAVMGAENLPVARLEGQELVVDGYQGQLIVQPSRQVRREYARLVGEERELAKNLSNLNDQPAETPDGYRMALYVNSGLLVDIEPALLSGAEGIGLYRTEFPFMIRSSFPSEDEQIPIYRQLLESFHPRPVTLRTLDIGGDKSLSYFPVNEDNPFLGWRGIRITLDHPELFLTQIRAMLRASVGLNNLRIMFPMISSVAEVDEACRLLDRAIGELQEEGVAVSRPLLGVMIEVPAAVYLTRALAKRVDFLSVGSNDLIQYLLAVDRNNPRVASLYSPFHPAVLMALQQIRRNVVRLQKPVYVCGEMAGDPAATILLLGMGYDALSVNVASLGRIKWVIRSFTFERAQKLLNRALRRDNPLDVRKMLDDALIEEGLGGLVRAGKY